VGLKSSRTYKLWLWVMLNPSNLYTPYILTLKIMKIIKFEFWTIQSGKILKPFYRSDLSGDQIITCYDKSAMWQENPITWHWFCVILNISKLFFRVQFIEFRWAINSDGQNFSTQHSKIIFHVEKRSERNLDITLRI